MLRGKLIWWGSWTGWELSPKISKISLLQRKHQARKRRNTSVLAFRPRIAMISFHVAMHFDRKWVCFSWLSSEVQKLETHAESSPY